MFQLIVARAQLGFSLSSHRVLGETSLTRPALAKVPKSSSRQGEFTRQSQAIGSEFTQLALKLVAKKT